jgi:hypothetical protein
VHFFIERQLVQSYLCMCMLFASSNKSHRHHFQSISSLLFLCPSSHSCLALYISERVQTTNLKMSQLPHAYRHLSWWTEERRMHDSFLSCFFLLVKVTGNLWFCNNLSFSPLWIFKDDQHKWKHLSSFFSFPFSSWSYLQRSMSLYWLICQISCLKYLYRHY